MANTAPLSMRSPDLAASDMDVKSVPMADWPTMKMRSFDLFCSMSWLRSASRESPTVSSVSAVLLMLRYLESQVRYPTFI